MALLSVSLADAHPTIFQIIEIWVTVFAPKLF